MSEWIEELVSGNHTAQAIQDLQAYYSRRLGYKEFRDEATFTGEFFDQWIPDPEPNKFTANDVVAVSMLDVHISGAAALEILEPGNFAGELEELLREIPTDTKLGDLGSVPTTDWAPWKLENTLRELADIGPVKASKLIARKRLHLYPIYDSVVAAMMGGTNRVLIPLWEALRETELPTKLTSLRRDAGLPDTMSILRVFDVVTWMEGRRRER